MAQRNLARTHSLTQIQDIVDKELASQRILGQATNRGGISIVVHDYGLAERSQKASLQCSRFLQAYVGEASNALRAGIIQEFHKQQLGGRLNTEATMLWKMWNGFDIVPLQQTGDLGRAIDGTIAEVGTGAGGKVTGRVIINAPTAGTDTAFDGQSRKNTDFVYLWSQEYGTQQRGNMFKFGRWHYGNDWDIPPRPFLNRGLANGYKNASIVMANGFADLYNYVAGDFTTFFGKMKMPSITNELALGMTDLIDIIKPPSAMYAVMGRTTDMLDIMKGGFDFPDVKSQGIQMAKGSVGATKRVQSRKLRRKIWGPV